MASSESIGRVIIQEKITEKLYKIVGGTTVNACKISGEKIPLSEERQKPYRITTKNLGQKWMKKEGCGGKRSVCGGGERKISHDCNVIDTTRR